MANMGTCLNNSIACAACQMDLSVGEEFLQCMVETCGKLYHYECNNKTLSADEKAIWACPECTCGLRKGGRNCDTMVGTPLNVKNVTLRKPSSGPTSTQRRQRLSEADISMPTSATLEIQLLREQITYLTEQLADAVITIGRYHTALTICTGKVEAISERLMVLEHSVESRGQSATTTMTLAPDDEVVKLDKPRKPRKRSHNRINKKKQLVTKAVTKPDIQVFVPPIETTTITTPNTHNSEVIEQSSSRTENIYTEDLDDFTSGKWEEFRSRKQRRLTSIRCTAGPNITSLRAVEERKYIHLWNMVSGADEVREYLQILCPGGTCTVEALKSRGDYKSYKLGVPAAYFEKCISADVWPENARVKMWFFPRRKVHAGSAT